jgi:hypothetical protein
MRLWKNMISSLADYKTSRKGFSRMVDNLQGSLDAGEFRDKELVSEWYDRWTDLETWRAADGDAVRYSEVAGIVEAMQQFLEERLRQFEGG